MSLCVAYWIKRLKRHKEKFGRFGCVGSPSHWPRSHDTVKASCPRHTRETLVLIQQLRGHDDFSRLIRLQYLLWKHLKAKANFMGKTRGRSVNQADGFVEITFPIIRPTETEWKLACDGKGRQGCTLDVGAAYRKMPVLNI